MFQRNINQVEMDSLHQHISGENCATASSVRPNCGIISHPFFQAGLGIFPSLGEMIDQAEFSQCGDSCFIAGFKHGAKVVPVKGNYNQSKSFLNSVLSPLKTFRSTNPSIPS